MKSVVTFLLGKRRNRQGRSISLRVMFRVRVRSLLLVFDEPIIPASKAVPKMVSIGIIYQL